MQYNLRVSIVLGSLTLALSGCSSPSSGGITLAVDQEIALDTVREIASGRFVDTNGDGVYDGSDEQQIWANAEPGQVMLDATGVLQTVLPDERRRSGRVADLDPAQPGGEFVTLSYQNGGSLRMSSFDGAGQLNEVYLDGEAQLSEPWLADLRGDGTVQIVTYDAIRDARTGTLQGHLEGVPYSENDGPRPVSADLDLDGVHEIVVFHPELGVRYYAPDGALLATCSPGTPDWTLASLAIGDMDGDPEGEVVVAGLGFVEVCDSDGTLLASAATAAVQTPMVGLGELDGDLAPEIVIGDQTRLLVYDDDLTLLFSVDTGPNWEGYAFSLADLDGDGFHEILVAVDRNPHRLVVLAGDGTELASVDVPDSAGWMGQPIVADFDADGLAEIAYPSIDGITIVDDGARGGWNVREADHPWSGVNRFPGDRTVSGAIPSGAAPHWSTPETNVWQGLPTYQHPHSGSGRPRR